MHIWKSCHHYYGGAFADNQLNSFIIFAAMHCHIMLCMDGIEVVMVTKWSVAWARL